MPRWVPRVLTRLRVLAAAGRLRFTATARAEASELGLSHEDVGLLLRQFTPSDRPTRLRSLSSHDWLYAFRPALPGLRLYLKVAIRADCVVISCHEDRPEAAEEADRDE